MSGRKNSPCQFHQLFRNKKKKTSDINRIIKDGVNDQVGFKSVLLLFNNQRRGDVDDITFTDTGGGEKNGRSFNNIIWIQG